MIHIIKHVYVKYRRYHVSLPHTDAMNMLKHNEFCNHPNYSSSVWRGTTISPAIILYEKLLHVMNIYVD